MSYQDQVSQLKDAGFSGQDIQGWSDNQAVKLRQGGFSQDEVDDYQGMKPSAPGTPPVYGRVPTDDDFKNAASVILKGNDHPFYQGAVDTLKNMFSSTGVEPAEAVKASQSIPSFQSIMENGGNAPSPTWGEYGTKFLHSMGSAVASGMQGLAVAHSYLNPDDPGIPLSEQGANPETTQMYQKGVAFQKLMDDKFSSNPETEKNNPIKMGLAGGVGSLVPLIATGGVGMATTGAGSAYQEAKQAGAPIEKAVSYATKMGGVWGALGVADVGVFLKPIERSAPGIISWLTAKATQALRSGVTFAGTNEFGNWLSSEIGKTADIPIQYKPTLQQVVINAALGAAAGVAGPTGTKVTPETIKAPLAERGIVEPQAPAPSAPATTLTPAYHFDSDSYGLKNEKGDFVQTGFGTEQEARENAEQAPAPTFPPTESRLTPEVIDRYKKTVTDQAEKLGFNLTPEQLQVAAQKMAESHNPIVEAKKPEVLPSNTPESQVDWLNKRAENFERMAEEAMDSGDDEKAKNARELAKQNREHASEIGMNAGLSPYVTIPKKPLGLADFVRQNGGINDEGGDVRSILGGARFRPGLINGEGKSIDDMARAAQEAGYFTGQERPSINEFKEKLSDDLHGNYQHSVNDIEKEHAYNEALRRNAEIDRMSTETGVSAERKTHTQFWDEITKYMSRDQAAEKRADFGQRAQDAYESWRTEALEPEERMSKEELENERTQDNINKDKAPIAEGVGKSGLATDYTREGEAVGGLGGRGTEPTGGARPAEETEGGFAATAVRADTSEGSGDAARSNAESPDLKEELLYQKGQLNRGILSAVRDPQHIQLLESVDKYLQRVLPKEYSYETTPGFIETDSGEKAYGLTDRTRNLITLSLQSPDQFATGAHEAMHAVRYLLTSEEWKALAKEAESKGLRDKYNIDNRYKEDQEEETIAHWYEDWQKNRAEASKTSSSLFDKIAKVFKNISAKVREVFGNMSADDIFKKIESGEVGQREGETGEGQLYEKVGQSKEEEKPTLGDAINGIRDTLSPTSAGDLAKKTEVEIRSSYGQAKRERSVAETALNEFARQANKMTPEDHADFYNYVEGRSRGAQLKNKQFQAMADTVRDIYGHYKDLIQAMPEMRMMHFVTDYFTHQWADGQEEKIKDFMNTWWQQGSGRNLKERKIPTIADGLSYGLKLAEQNPVRAVSRYAGSMSNYLASVKILRAINNDLGGGYYADGLQPEGYKPLVGKNAERIENARIDPASGKIIPARNLKLYAPEQVANLYNAFYSKGFEDTRLKAPYMLARNAINTNTLMELGLSAYHFSTINMQSLNQDMGRILRNIFAGDWQGVGDAIRGLVTPAFHFREGAKLMDQYNDLKDHGIDMERIADEFSKSNLRVGLDPLSNVSTHGGFYKAWQRGELPQVIDRLKSQMTEGYGVGALKSGAEAVARVVSDVSHPLFNVYVPTIKMSAFHDLMGDWLRQNKGATDAEIAQARVRIGDMVEDRFGEMNMENLFWNKKAKELLGLGLRAPGWDIGLVRQAGGAGYDVYRMIKDGIKGNGFDVNRLDRPLFIVGAAITYAAINSAMTYLKTGVSPDDQKLKDFIAYATGGMHKAFGMHPERGELPGHGREMLQMAPIPGQGPLSGVTQEAANKVATLPKKAYEAATNTDWTGKPIYDPKSKNWYQRIPGVAQAVHIASGFEPFSMEQLFQGKPEGSNLSLAERFMGVRAAGAKIVNPEGLRKFNEEKRH